MDLVIMAGGLGSRFGGLKQVEAVDNHGNFIIDYTIYDAIKCGFEKVIIIINKNNLQIFEETIGKRVKSHIKIEYVFQENLFPKMRNKPLGTAHAVLCAKEKVKDKFVVVNADDFYGYESLLIAKHCLSELKPKELAMVCFKVKNTLSNFGAVKRGLCQVDDDGYLKNIHEYEFWSEDEKIFAKELNNHSDVKIVNEDCLVSMNLWAFDKSIFEILENGFGEFCLDEDNIKFKEYFLPGAVADAIDNHGYRVKVVSTSANWFGLTYKEDKQTFIKNLNLLIKNNQYPEDLWG